MSATDAGWEDPFSEDHRVLVHPDGRIWCARAANGELRFHVIDDEGDRIRRARRAKDHAAARSELDALVSEQLADGFATPPPERAYLESLAAWWADEDRTFDADALRRAVLDHPDGLEAIGAVMRLRDRWTADERGLRADVYDDEREAPYRLAEVWLLAHPDASLPAMQLALRMPSSPGQSRAASAIAKHPRAREAIAALTSAIEHPGEDLAVHLGGRPNAVSCDVLVDIALPDAEVTPRLARLLAHVDLRIVHAVGHAFARHAQDDAVFEALWSARSAASLAFAVAHAAIVRGDPSIVPELALLRDAKRDRGEREAIDEAIHRLTSPPAPPPLPPLDDAAIHRLVDRLDALAAELLPIEVGSWALRATPALRSDGDERRALGATAWAEDWLAGAMLQLERPGSSDVGPLVWVEREAFEDLDRVEAYVRGWERAARTMLEHASRAGVPSLVLDHFRHSELSRSARTAAAYEEAILASATARDRIRR